MLPKPRFPLLGEDRSGLAVPMLSVQLLSFEERAMGWAYVDKNSETGRRLYERLKNSRYHKLVADFSYPPEADSADYFVMNELWVTDTWVLSN